MTAPQEHSAAVARLASALERQAEELRTVRSHAGLAPRVGAKLLRPDDVATRLAKSRAWVYRNQYALGGFRVGGQVRFESAAIDGYVERCRDGAAEPAAGGVAMLPIRNKPEGSGMTGHR